MGYNKIECALYITCRGDKQKKELAKRFEEEHPGNDRLFMWNTSVMVHDSGISSIFRFGSFIVIVPSSGE